MTEWFKNRRNMNIAVTLLLLCVIIVASVFVISNIVQKKQYKKSPVFMEDCLKLTFKDGFSAEQGDLLNYLSVKPDDEDAIKNILPYVRQEIKVSVDENEIDVLSVGTSAEYSDIAGLEFKEGRFFMDKEVSGRRHRVVVTSSVAEKLFGEEEALLKEITIDKEVYTIVGVIDEGVYCTADSGEFEKDIIFLPYTIGRKALKTAEPTQYIISTKNAETAKEDIKNYLKHQKIEEEKYVIE